MSKMHISATRSDSSGVEESSLHTALMNSLSYNHSDSVGRTSQNHVFDGLAVPSVLGEAMGSSDCLRIMATTSRAAITNSDEFLHSTQPGRDIAIDLTAFLSYPQINHIGDSDRFVARLPLPVGSSKTVVNGRFDSNGHQEKVVSSSPSVHYPSECTKTGTAGNASCVMNSSFEPMHCGYESVPLDTSTRRNLNKCTIPTEVVETIIGKTGLQPVQVMGSCCLPIERMITERGLNCNHPGSSRFSSGISLSIPCRNSAREQCSEISSSGTMFVQAMQEILSEIAFYALETTGIENGANFPFSSCRIAGKGHRASSFPDNINEGNTFAYQDNYNVEAKKKHLLALLQLVDDRYNQCLHEIHTVSSAFHAVTELDPNLHARFALPMVSLMYKNLRERISNQILPPVVEGGMRDEQLFEACSVEKRWALQQLSKADHQLWRPQRGLPERSVSVLRAWMFQNFLHPYPKDADKHLLALKSGLTRNQVSNWFINARVRLWKPMIEEMYAELNRRSKST